MSSAPITSVYNDGYIAETYEAYRRDPASVDESWRQFFRFAEQLGGVDKSATTVAADPVYLRKVAGAAALVDAIRQYGHLAVQLDPLGSPPPGAAELTPEFHGITAADLQLVPALALGFDVGTGADVAARLRELYSSTIGFEFAHLGEEAEREWFRETIEHERLARYLTPEEKRTALRRLTEVDGLERFIGRAWVNMKRFSIEGTDALVPMLDVLIEDAGRAGAREVVIAMAHRGRINVLTHILGKPYATVFGEFDGRHAAAAAESETGDVKYHLGARTERTLADGRTIGVQLVPNPSHLEVVNPVVTGVARARQRVSLGERLTGEFDPATVAPVIVHGDAAFPGEGIVAESLNLSRLRGYTVGGSLHIIVNNQVGFTTDPTDARSTHYASDLAKGFEIPIVHVNADDLEACIAAVRLGVAYRTKFNKDFLIDLVGYRRHGHNEGDEPTFTQPTLYATIKAHPTPRQVWGERLVREGIVTPEDVQAAEREVAKELEEIYDESKKVKTEEFEIEHSKPAPTVVETAVRAEQLVALNEQLLAWPTGFSAHPRLAKQLERRREAMGEEGGIDWGHAESLAFASLLAEGTSVRMSGQDAERGTFSHRHAVLHDPNTGQTFTPLQHLPNARGQFEIFNSPLSETGVLGFEYGYSTAADDSLVLWEAQFGDFVNVAQPIIDQFIAADRAKWAQDSGVVMLLPHGYEGQGPEHSSARLERFLQLCADGNLTVAYPTTPAQYFHILRRQAKSDSRRPLVLMQPKSLLRLPQAASRLDDLVNGRFASVIDDPAIGDRRDEVQRVVFCTGKLFYDLNAKERPANVAIARVEELYPWPAEQVSRVVDLYRNVTEVVWAQEEPKNMGAWTYVWPRLRACTGNAMLIRYVGRPERASPAEGYVASHQEEQARIVTETLEVPTRRKAAARS
ncbi:MAG TPA: 2-oxoglutarate dehydrogenase E1 component [Gemmatimonadaceae bacterium]|nr:2-oxoglutarate dehydrogenase E1 component [Gemmatimonadaceae bacterium]